MNDKAKCALEYYKEARAEIREHIKLRQQALFIFLAILGVLAGMAINRNDNGDLQVDTLLLLVIPFLSFGVGVILGQRDLFCGCLSKYCVEELSTHLPEIPMWDNSDSLVLTRRWLFLLRSLVHMLIIVLPAAVALRVSYPKNNASINELWLLGLALTLATMIWFLFIYIYRRYYLKY